MAVEEGEGERRREMRQIPGHSARALRHVLFIHTKRNTKSTKRTKPLYYPSGPMLKDESR